MRKNDLNNPCLNCNERCVGCHSECVRYKDWKAEYDSKVKHECETRSEIYNYDNYRIAYVRSGLGNSKKRKK